MHGQKVEIRLERLRSHTIAITNEPVDEVTTQMLAKTAQLGKFDPTRLVTKHFELDLILDAWDTFRRAAETTALEVIIGV